MSGPNDLAGYVRYCCADSGSAMTRAAASLSVTIGLPSTELNADAVLFAPLDAACKP
jgi:hypothetical protein